MQAEQNNGSSNLNRGHNSINATQHFEEEIEIPFDQKDASFLGGIHHLNEITDKLADQVERKMTLFGIENESTSTNVWNKYFELPEGFVCYILISSFQILASNDA